MSTEKIPKTDSIQELAQFWDSHDLTDFEDQLEEISEPVFQRETVVKIHLAEKDVEVVKQMAKAKGVAFAELIRGWVLERVQAP
jgi:predicted DNA binding CopG/RHH family protein